MCCCFYGFFCFSVAYITLAVDEINGCGLNTTVHHEHLPKKTMGNAVLATEGIPESSTRWSAPVIKVSGQCVAMHLKKASRQLHSNIFQNFWLSTISLLRHWHLKLKNNLFALLYIY